MEAYVTDPSTKLVLDAWKPYINAIDDWKMLVRNIEPKLTGCGFVYELPNPQNRPRESFAIADMRQIDISEPHKHINDETEIYFVLQGTGKLAVGAETYNLVPGMSVVTPPDTAHCTLSNKELVMQ